ncbi:hypothetical protein M0R19_00755 [Candidatus Pacearchaeota archaeon]|nr:hypothetical protein [Candidatus Pacearchaeota archaeon]
MAPLIDVSNEVLNRLNQLGIHYKLKNSESKKRDNSNFIYVPSINLYVAKERTLLGKDFYESQNILHENNEKMLTPFEFIEFLKYTKENHQDIYNETTKVQCPWKAEWLGADFKTEGDCMYVIYSLFDSKGKIVQKKEILDRNTLMRDKTPGISLDNYLQNPTKQGFPSKKVKSVNLYSWYPRSNNNLVERFNAFEIGGACLFGYRLPSFRNSNLGVRAAKLLD